MAEPLRNLHKDSGRILERPARIEAQIDALLRLPSEEVARRAREEGPSSPLYVSIEAVLYFVRRKRTDHCQPALRSLYETLRHRTRQWLAKAPRTAGTLTLEEANERTLFRLDELLSQDRREYELRLDFYECQFVSALYMARLNRIRDVKNEAPERFEALEAENQGEPSPEVERALASLAGQSPEDERDRDYRLRLFEVIKGLPDGLKRVIEMHDLRGMPMDSKKEGVISVASVLNLGEQAVRNRRNKALRALREALSRTPE